MTPYYEQDGITIYHGDCLDILPSLPAQSFAWYDPPYNVGKNYGESYNDNQPDEEYFYRMAKIMKEVARIAPSSCVFTPTKYALWYWMQLGVDFKQIILSWSPEGTFRGNFVNQFSFLLTNASPVRYTKNVWHNCQMSGLGYFFRENNFNHPGYTSEDITERVLGSFTNERDTIIDPFLGTGTTAVVAKRSNRRAIGIEISEKYCEIAVKRLAQMQLEFK